MERVKEIVCRVDRCLACRACEIACALEHSRSHDLSRAIREEMRPLPRVRVLLIDEQGRKVRARSLALQCRHCEEPACLAACIAGGIRQEEETGRVTFDAQRCVGCWSCIMVCPFGAVVRSTGHGCALKCDLCPERDTPACVAACPVRALVLVEPEEEEAGCVEETTAYHRK